MIIRGTVRRKILTGENIDEFDKFLAIRQYFPYQNFPFRFISYLPLINLWQSIFTQKINYQGGTFYRKSQYPKPSVTLHNYLIHLYNVITLNN